MVTGMIPFDREEIAMVRQILKTKTATRTAASPLCAEPLTTEPREASAVLAANICAISPPRASSKLSIVLGLLQIPEGASLAKLVGVTDWQPHTARAALTGLRKRGYLIAVEKVVDADGAKRSIYKITTEQVR